MSYADKLRQLLETTTDRPEPEYFIADGLMVTVWSHNKVVNIDHRDRDLERSDVDALRAAFTELGYEERDSWIPMQGVSWMSGGVSAGASFRIAKTA